VGNRKDINIDELHKKLSSVLAGELEIIEGGKGGLLIVKLPFTNRYNKEIYIYVEGTASGRYQLSDGSSTIGALSFEDVDSLEKVPCWEWIREEHQLRIGSHKELVRECDKENLAWELYYMMKALVILNNI
jgi:hypothetical protein